MRREDWNVTSITGKSHLQEWLLCLSQASFIQSFVDNTGRIPPSFVSPSRTVCHRVRSLKPFVVSVPADNPLGTHLALLCCNIEFTAPVAGTDAEIVGSKDSCR